MKLRSAMAAAIVLSGGCSSIAAGAEQEQAARPAVADPAWAETQRVQRRLIIASLDVMRRDHECGRIDFDQMAEARRMGLAAMTELRSPRAVPIPANRAFEVYIRDTEARAEASVASSECIAPAPRR